MYHLSSLMVRRTNKASCQHAALPLAAFLAFSAEMHKMEVILFLE